MSHFPRNKDNFGAYKISLTQPPIVEVVVQLPEIEWSCIYVRAIDSDSVSTFLLFDFETVPTVWYFLCFIYILRWYLTLKGDNSLKSVERFDHMMFVCRFQASR